MTIGPRETGSPRGAATTSMGAEAVDGVQRSILPTDELSGQTDDFSTRLHELRSRELRRLPDGARTILSGGCSDSWYFEWFAENYPTAPERHIGIDVAPPPDELPSGVEWYQRSLGEIGGLAAREVDLVFAGQVIEHLWPDEIVGFLVGAQRVLRQGGVLALDSPNRAVTQPLGWAHPEHTIEFSVEEIVELLQLAGFREVSVRGILLNYDREFQRLLPLEPLREDPWTWERRAKEAEHRPEDSFIWWAEALRAEREPDVNALRVRVDELFARFRSIAAARFQHEVGAVVDTGNRRVVRASRGESGYLVRGPGIPVPPGRWRALFWLEADLDGGADDAEPIGSIAAMVDDDRRLAFRELTTADAAKRALGEMALAFSLSRTAANLQLLVHSTGRLSVSAGLPVAIEPVTETTEESVEEPVVEQLRPAAEESVAGRAAAEQPRAGRSKNPVKALARTALWPLRRFFDPRFQGLAAQMDAVRDHLDKGSREIHDQTRALVHAEAGAVTESSEMVGRSLADLQNDIAGMREFLEHHISIVEPRKGPAIPPQVPWEEEYVHSHQHFVAEVLDSPELVELFGGGERLPVGYGVGLDERVVEYPWTLAQELHGRTLDAGSSLNHAHVLPRFLSRVEQLHIITLAPEDKSFPELGVSYVYGDLRSLPFRDDLFDTIVCISTVDHVGMDNSQYGAGGKASDDPQAEARTALAELTRVVAPGGTLLLTVPYGRQETFGHTRQFDQAELDELVETARPNDCSISVYHYDVRGWQLSSLEEAADASFHDYLADRGPTEDLAAAARGVACLKLTF